MFCTPAPIPMEVVVNVSTGDGVNDNICGPMTAT